MKKVKINLLPIIGMMVAVATLAFTAPKQEAINNPNEDPLWHYTGNSSAGEGDPQMYEPADGEESCPGFDEVICLISAPLNTDGVTPDLTQAETRSYKF